MKEQIFIPNIVQEYRQFNSGEKEFYYICESRGYINSDNFPNWMCCNCKNNCVFSKQH